MVDDCAEDDGKSRDHSHLEDLSRSWTCRRLDNRETLHLASAPPLPLHESLGRYHAGYGSSIGILSLFDVFWGTTRDCSEATELE